MSAPQHRGPDPEAGHHARAEGSWRQRRPATVTAVVLTVICAAAGLGWLLWAAYGHATSPKVQPLGYEITGSTVMVRFELVRQPEDEVSCVVRARDRAGAEVARELVTIDPGRRRVVVDHRLRATRTPVTGEVESCRTT